MLRAAPLLLSVVVMSLSACSGEQAPRLVTPTQGHSSQADFGALRVYYNLLPTLAMNESVARSYGVQRSADHALLVVALRQRNSTEDQRLIARYNAEINALTREYGVYTPY